MYICGASSGLPRNSWKFTLRCTVSYGFVFPEEWKCASQVGSVLVQLGNLGLEEALTTCPQQTNEKSFIKITK